MKETEYYGHYEHGNAFPWEQWQSRSLQQKYPSLAQVLSSWELAPVSAGVEGTVCRVKCQHGNWWALKRVEQRDRAEFTGALLAALSQYQLTPPVMKTKYGDNIAYWFDGYYYLMPLIRGKEGSNRKLGDISLAAGRLALIHQYSRNLSLPDFAGSNPQELTGRLQQYTQTARLDVDKIESTSLRLEVSDYLYALQSRLANFPRYQLAELEQQAAKEQTLCHRHYHCGQLLKEQKNAFVVHWDEAAIGVQLLDLADFCRKVLQKNKWQPEYFLAIINGYQDILPLTEAEKSLLEAILLLPAELELALAGKKGKKPKGKELENILAEAIALEKQKNLCLEAAKGNILPSRQKEKEKEKAKEKAKKAAKKAKEKEKQKAKEKKAAAKKQEEAKTPGQTQQTQPKQQEQKPKQQSKQQSSQQSKQQPPQQREQPKQNQSQSSKNQENKKN